MFGYKSSWLVVRTDDVESVSRVLIPGSADVVETAVGVQRVTERFSGLAVVFGPVEGWTVAFFDLMYMDNPKVFNLVDVLADAYGEAQLFSSFRIVDCYSWERKVAGGPLRLMMSVQGRLREDHGIQTPIEQSLKVPRKRRLVPTRSNVDQDTVLQIAESWSFNPLRLGKDLAVDSTFIGQFLFADELPTNADAFGEALGVR